MRLRSASRGRIEVQSLSCSQIARMPDRSKRNSKEKSVHTGLCNSDRSHSQLRVKLNLPEARLVRDGSARIALELYRMVDWCSQSA